jgi:cysteine desulfurase
MWFFGSKRIYLDYASSTPVAPAALSAMRDADRFIGNPGAIHVEGVEAKKALERAREGVAHELGCKAREIIFTSGLTESNNLAILGLGRKLAMAGRFAGTHWIVSSIEHDAVLQSFAEVERLGGIVTHIEPDARGVISPETVLRALRPQTVLVSVGWANNEIGVVQPVREISRAVREKNPSTLIHSDAGQGALYVAPHVHTLGVDLFSLGSNKLYGPHGIGALFVSNRADLAARLLGGRQERGLRAGTESVALAAGFAAAFAQVAQERAREAPRLRALRDTLERGIAAHVGGVIVNGDLKRALPHMLNISIPNISSEYITLALDRAGVAVSTKSACREGDEARSHVVEALGGPAWRAHNTFRFSLGRDTTETDIEKAIRTLVNTLA